MAFTWDSDQTEPWLSAHLSVCPYHPHPATTPPSSSTPRLGSWGLTPPSTYWPALIMSRDKSCLIVITGAVLSSVNTGARISPGHTLEMDTQCRTWKSNISLPAQKTPKCSHQWTLSANGVIFAIPFVCCQLAGNRLSYLNEIHQALYTFNYRCWAMRWKRKIMTPHYPFRHGMAFVI